MFIILPPNLDQAIARGKVMLVFEAKWSGGRCPLNALPKGRAFAFSPQDNAIIEQLETLADGETPALLQMETKDFAALLPVLAEHPNITLGKASAVTVTRTPLQTAAARHAGGERGNRPGAEGEDGGVRDGRRLGLAEADACSRSACRPPRRMCSARRCACRARKCRSS